MTEQKIYNYLEKRKDGYEVEIIASKIDDELQIEIYEYIVGGEGIDIRLPRKEAIKMAKAILKAFGEEEND